MSTKDPKIAAQKRFASRRWGEQALDLVTRCATDPPVVLAGLIDAVRERAGPGSRVVELGFGSGWLLEALRDQLPETQLHGLDMSLGFVGRAYQEHRSDARVLIGDMERLPYREDAFDVVATCWTLYFMRDIDIALEEIKRCLKPGGRLIAATNAPDHELEVGELISEAIRLALGREEPDHDVGHRFDLATGAASLSRHFSRVEVRRWDGELVLVDPNDVEALWQPWEPPMMEKHEQRAVRAEFVRLAREVLARGGELRIRRRSGMFLCDRSSP